MYVFLCTVVFVVLYQIETFVWKWELPLLLFPLQNLMEAGERQASLILLRISHFDRNASAQFSVESMVFGLNWVWVNLFDWTLLCYRSLASARRTVQEYLWRISVKSPGWWFCRRVTSFHKPQRQQWSLMNQKLTKQTSSKKRKRSLECQVCIPAILTDFCPTPKNGFAGVQRKFLEFRRKNLSNMFA